MIIDDCGQNKLEELVKLPAESDDFAYADPGAQTQSEDLAKMIHICLQAREHWCSLKIIAIIVGVVLHTAQMS